MNKIKYEKMIDEKLATLKEELIEELMQEVEEEREDEFPKLGETYWYISSSGDIYWDKWDDTQTDRNRLAMGNVFRTREEVEFELEKRKVIAELKKYAKPKDREWNGENEHWCIYYNYLDQEIKCYGPFLGLRYTDIYFETEEKTREVINAVGEDRIKKYYLGIE